MESLHWVMMAAWAVEAHWVHVGTGTKSDKINCLDYFSRMDARYGLVAEALFKAPSAFLQVVGAGIGGLTFKLSPATRARAMENLKLAGYDDPHLYERVGRNAGRQAMESLWVWYRPAETVLKRVHIAPEAEAMVREAVDSGRPIVFLTPHVGCFEVLPVWFAATFLQGRGAAFPFFTARPR